MIISENCSCSLMNFKTILYNRKFNELTMYLKNSFSSANLLHIKFLPYLEFGLPLCFHSYPRNYHVRYHHPHHHHNTQYLKIPPIPKYLWKQPHCYAYVYPIHQCCWRYQRWLNYFRYIKPRNRTQKEWKYKYY